MKAEEELEYLRMENSLLKSRLMDLTNNPEYIRPYQDWIGHEPEIIDMKTSTISYTRVASARVDLKDYGHHIFTRVLGPDGQWAEMNYMISASLIRNYNEYSLFAYLRTVLEKIMKAITYHMIHAKYGWEKK
jgi:hypothetical protein